MKSLSLGMPLWYIPANFKNTQASKLGHPLLHQQFIRSFLVKLYFYSFTSYVSYLERLLFLLSVCLVFFVVINSWILACFVWERDTLRFHCLEHSSFHSYCSVSVHFLLVLRLALVFHSYFV